MQRELESMRGFNKQHARQISNSSSSKGTKMFLFFSCCGELLTDPKETCVAEEQKEDRPMGKAVSLKDDAP